jgi:RpiB/LacA/LacB family sugar-phosphate isomerase
MKKYNILLPIAGQAQRFKDAGYTMPKPLIMAKDSHIIDLALDSINIQNCHLIFAVRLEHINNFAIDTILLNKFGNDIDIVVVDGDTEGSVCTCLLASEYIDNDVPLIIYTPDVCFSPTLNPNTIPDSDGFLLTFKANSPAHSYLHIDENAHVIRTAEKQVISTTAAVGIYYFKTGSSFVHYAKQMLSNNIKTKNEFYICPIYNLLIEDNKRVLYRSVEKMHVLGTPDELNFFIDNVHININDKPIGICSDHSGFSLKENLKHAMEQHGIRYIDFGCLSPKDVDYGDFVLQVTGAIQNKICDFGIGICRTGQGINMLANHISGIRSGLIFDKYTAEMAIRHNCVNFFSLASKYISTDDLSDLIGILKTTTFDGGRHMTRMKKTIDIK